MIVRSFRCRTFRGKETEWRRSEEELSIPWLRGQSGLIEFHMCQSFFGGDRRSFVMLTLWESTGAVRAAFGDNWRQSRFPNSQDQFLENFELDHFETVGSFFHSFSS
jgi:heme-degrading monooxygenase HmoA